MWVLPLLIKGVVDHASTLIRAHSSTLTYYLVLLELDHVDHTTSNTVFRIKVTKVDLTTIMQRILPYQYVQQFIQLPPTWLGEPIELKSAHQALTPCDHKQQCTIV